MTWRESEDLNCNDLERPNRELNIQTWYLLCSEAPGSALHLDTLAAPPFCCLQGKNTAFGFGSVPKFNQQSSTGAAAAEKKVTASLKREEKSIYPPESERLREVWSGGSLFNLAAELISNRKRKQLHE